MAIDSPMPIIAVIPEALTAGPLFARICKALIATKGTTTEKPGALVTGRDGVEAISWSDFDATGS
jgi:hypothetical protein